MKPVIARASQANHQRIYHALYLPLFLQSMASFEEKENQHGDFSRHVNSHSVLAMLFWKELGSRDNNRKRSCTRISSELYTQTLTTLPFALEVHLFSSALPQVYASTSSQCSLEGKIRELQGYYIYIMHVGGCSDSRNLRKKANRSVTSLTTLLYLRLDLAVA